MKVQASIADDGPQVLRGSPAEAFRQAERADLVLDLSLECPQGVGDGADDGSGGAPVHGGGGQRQTLTSRSPRAPNLSSFRQVSLCTLANCRSGKTRETLPRWPRNHDSKGKGEEDDQSQRALSDS